MAELTRDEIRTLAARTDQTHAEGKSLWKKTRISRLRSSNFVMGLAAILNPHESSIEKLKGDIYFPKNIDSIPAIKWGKEHEPVAISAYVNETHAIYDSTGIWMYKNNMLGASPDGLILTATRPQERIGVI